MGGFTDPTTLALLGASAGFLDPHGGMAAGFQGAMKGLQAGNDMKRQKELDALEAQKVQSKTELQSWLKDNIKPDGSGKFDIRNAGNKMLATGHPELMGMGINLLKQAPKAKYQNVNNNGVIERQAEFDDGNIGASGGLPIAAKAMQVNTGDKISLVDPYARGEFGVNMSQGEQARLAQSQQQFGASHGLAQQNHGIAQQRLAQDQKTNIQPKFVDGAWVIPPDFNNPKGTIIPTDMYAPPKGSAAEKTKSNAKIGEILGDDTEGLIKASTGSFIGAGIDMGARALGVATPGSKAIATLKVRSSQLAGNVPRFEGAQSNADRDYYVQMVGNLDDSTIPVEQRLLALKELERMHKLVKPDGSVNLGGNRGTNKGGASGSFGGSNDGWGDLK